MRFMQSFVTTVREVEKTTGLDFFSALPADLQDELENSSNLSLWEKSDSMDSSSK